MLADNLVPVSTLTHPTPQPYAPPVNPRHRPFGCEDCDVPATYGNGLRV
jgi:hypothetical protein